MFDWLHSYSNDIIGAAISAVLVLCYYGYTFAKTKYDPAYTVRAVMRISRGAWVQALMRERNGILAVQTLRNSTMAASFLASTAILLMIGVLSLSAQGEHLRSNWHALNWLGSTAVELWLIKLLFLLAMLFAAFVCFSQSVRVYNHVGFMISVPLELQHKKLSPDHVAMHLNSAGRFYAYGMRSYYLTAPLISWLFGPAFMVLGTVALIVAMYYLDRAPDIKERADGSPGADSAL